MSEKYHLYPLTIRETHLDTFGHVNNAIYLTLLEEARWEYITSNGYSLEKIRETLQGPTILEIKINFYKELKARDKVVIRTTLVSYQKKIGKLKQEMLRNDDEVCCVAEFIIALFDLRERKLILPTDDWLRALGIEPESYPLQETT